jgi:hypothetical protein
LSNSTSAFSTNHINSSFHQGRAELPSDTNIETNGTRIEVLEIGKGGIAGTSLPTDNSALPIENLTRSSIKDIRITWLEGQRREWWMFARRRLVIVRSIQRSTLPAFISREDESAGPVERVRRRLELRLIWEEKFETAVLARGGGRDVEVVDGAEVVGCEFRGIYSAVFGTWIFGTDRDDEVGEEELRLEVHGAIVSSGERSRVEDRGGGGGGDYLGRPD